MKTYKVNGVEYKLIPCSAKRAEDFQKQYEIVEKQCAEKKQYSSKAILARTVVERVKPDSKMEEPNWVTDVDMQIVLEVLADFFFLFNPNMGVALSFLIGLNQEEVLSAVSMQKNGQQSGPENKV